MEFKDFTELVKQRFDFLSNNDLYIMDVNRDEIWDLYLKSFPEGTNPILKTRTEYDCNTCKNFIRDIGSVVAIIDDNVQTIWDVDVQEPFNTVAQSLAEFVRSKPINNVFLHYQANVGAQKTNQLLEDKTVKSWNHFYGKIPAKFVHPEPGVKRNVASTGAQSFLRGLLEISHESLDTVIDLIKQGSLYRGSEFLELVQEFKKLKLKADTLDSDLKRNNFAWLNSSNFAAKIRTTVIGTLLLDLSADVDLDTAVAKFEAKVAPTNYKRPTALITKGIKIEGCF